MQEFLFSLGFFSKIFICILFWYKKIQISRSKKEYRNWDWKMYFTIESSWFCVLAQMSLLADGKTSAKIIFAIDANHIVYRPFFVPKLFVVRIEVRIWNAFGKFAANNRCW